MRSPDAIRLAPDNPEVWTMRGELMRNLGRTTLAAEAAAKVLARGPERGGRKPSCLVGRDTRVSGDMIEGALVAGLNSMGADAVLCGVLPTPAVAFLATQTGAAFGAVVSASHNPFQDNGIKFVGGDGYKLSDDDELLIEAALSHENIDAQRGEIRSGSGAGKARRKFDAQANCRRRVSAASAGCGS